MLFPLFLVISAFLLHAFAQSQYLQTLIGDPDPPCATGVHMIVIRATGEKQGYGILGEVVTQIEAQINGSSGEAIVYPAEGITNVSGIPIPNLKKYKYSETWGTINMTIAIKEYTSRCPESRIALLGYSQGAHVIGDVLCGRTRWNQSDPLPVIYTGNIDVILQFGDPSNVDGIPWHVGNGSGNGLFPRTDIEPCQGYAPRWQSYCDNKDYFCTSRGDIAHHLHYLTDHNSSIIDFIVENVQKSSRELLF